ncbi:MAG: GIY-YIG nuclease family protein [Candidatus Omnitrophica bacterium]|nr:GIY-YIG nuclease family protein [Candidatus Omnitrophota bacterium]
MNREYYFYILQCSDGSKYYGHTNDLKRRIFSHFKGQVSSTKNKRPLRLVYFEKCDSRSVAFKREMQFKNGRTRMKTIEKMIGSFSQEKCQGFNAQTAYAYDV